MGNKKHYTKSIMPTERGTCYICGCNQGFQRHHCLHGSANRQIAEKEGIWIWLCYECHIGGKYSVHQNRRQDLMIEQDGQMMWENKYKVANDATEEEARTAFMELFGKSWL